jgi:tetratricopeptide (TPR) repeat protein/O-antigen ligase
MFPAAIASLFRFSSIAVSAVLIIAPWLISTQSEDPYLFQNWLVFSLAALAISEMAVIFLFFRPRRGHFGFIKPLLMIFIFLSASMYFSPFSTSLRVTLLWLSLFVLTAFLRLSRKQQDNESIAGMFCLSGFFMAIYALFQHFGYDFFHWTSSPHKIVGTFSNPNFLAAYLMLTSIFTLGITFELPTAKIRERLSLVIMFLVQAAVIILSGAISATIGLVLGIILLLTSFWEVKPGRILRSSPFVAGAIVCIVLILLQGLVYYASSNYPWENLASSPYRYFSVVSRLVVWQMGFSVFLDHPLIGLGPGAIRFMMPQQRPPFGTSLGLRLFNDDPHSIVVSLLAETGLAGLLALSAFVCYLFGIAIWRRSKCLPENKAEETDEVSFSWAVALLMLVISALGFGANFISLQTFFYSIPAIIMIQGLFNSLRQRHYLRESQRMVKTPLVCLIVFVFHSTFNNNISVLPLLLAAVSIASLLISNSLRDVIWHKRFSFTTLPYLCVPVLYVFVAYNLQGTYQQEQTMLFHGSQALGKGEPGKAQLAFESAIRANPQSLKAHFGLAMSLKRQNLLDDARNILEKLDQMVPNAFNTNYELARLLLERKHLLEAHRYALKSLEWNMTPQSYELLGKILLQEGKFADAKKVFEEALVIVPEHIREERLAADRIRLSLAALAANESNFERCENYLKEIRSSVSENSDALYLRALILSRSGNNQEALDLFEKALIQSPENPKLMNAVGFILVKENIDLDRAQKLLEAAHQLIKSNETPMLSDLLMVAHSLGILYWKQGKLDQAEKLLEIAWEQCPDNWEAQKAARLEDLKRFYRETGKVDELNRFADEQPTKTGSNTERITDDQ